MLDDASNGALLVILLPAIAVIGIALNLLIRARGGRSFSLKLKCFGVDLHIESSQTKKKYEVS